MFWSKKKKDPECVICGLPADYGYSPKAESEWKDIRPLCDVDIWGPLGDDFQAYQGKAVVFRADSSGPCYIFRPVAEIAGGVPENIAEAYATLLGKLRDNCEVCSTAAHFALVEDRTEVASRNSAVKALCGKCCVDQISIGFPAKIFEVCGPKGDQNGVQLPIGY